MRVTDQETMDIVEMVLVEKVNKEIVLFAKDAQPETVARGLVECFGFRRAYVADLDAIAGQTPNLEAL